MRAYEFLNEHSSRMPTISLRSLNKDKHKQYREGADREWRLRLYPIMYGRTDRQQELADATKARIEVEQLAANLEQSKLETAMLRAEYEAFRSGFRLISQEAITDLAKKGMAQENASKAHVEKLAKSEMRRRKK